MAGIQRLSVVNDESGTSFGSGILAFDATGDFFISVIATNTASTAAEIYVYSVPDGAESNQSAWALVAYKLPLPSYNSYETFRFGLSNTDKLYVAGSAGVHYFVQGLEQVG